MAMKESGIEWVGLIPDTWSVIPNKYVMHKEKNLCEKWSGEDVMSLTMNGVIVRDLQNPTGKMPATFDGYQYIEDGDLLMCLFDIDVTPRCVGRVTHDGVTSPAYSNFKVHDNVSRDYFYYYYLMVDNTKELLHLAKNLRHSFTEEQLGQLKVPMPPLSEQQAIADYLDKTCSKIDEIIAEAKASIDEYKELKQSVIFEAVTKGLDKNVEMKDSGIEWIGEIPKNWTLYRLKHLLQSPMQYGANATGLEYDKTMPRYVRITDIDSNGNLKDVGKQSLSWDVAEPYLLKDGDLLLARSGGTVGKAFLYKKSYGTCAFAGYLIRAKANDKVLPEYIHYYTLSKGYEIWKNGIFIKATIQNIGADKYANLPIPIPTDIEIQREVVKYLDSKCNTLDSLIAEKESLIKDLESYKKSLIYEVVTGKRRVV